MHCLNTDAKSQATFESIPEALRARPQWVLWRPVLRKGTKTKCPFAPDGTMAKANDPATWASFEVVAKAYRANSRCWAGVGFMLSPPFVGIDLDGVLRADGSLRPWPRELLEQFARPGDGLDPREIINRLNTYGEISPSGRGVKLYCLAAMPGERHRIGNKSAGLEIYDRARFFTVTGWHFEGTPAEVAECSEALKAIYDAIFGPSARSNGTPQPTRGHAPTDGEVWAAIARSKNADRVLALAAGDTGGYASPSEADLALASLLSFWTTDRAQIERMMRGTGLARPKWARPDYLERTIARALEIVTEHYDWDAHRTRTVGSSTPTEKPQAETEKPQAETEKIDARKLDSAAIATGFLSRTQRDGLFTLRLWRGAFWRWEQGRYRELPTSEVRGSLVRHLNEFATRVTVTCINNVLEQVRALSILDSDTEPPVWLGSPPPEAQSWSPTEILACRNGLVHLPSVFREGEKTYIAPPTPRYFATAAIDLDFSLDVPPPETWLRFLGELWPDEPESIGLLQQWFGYTLIPDTRHQKMLALVGPPRSGKSTICRILRALVGAENVAGPTLASLGNAFGVAPLLNKAVAIIPDARLTSRSDLPAIVGVLLSLSGEDALSIDRKFLPPVTCRLKTRLMLVANELPSVDDVSGALASRLVVLRLKNSFAGREDHNLAGKLLGELPQIFAWAVEGWHKLWRLGRFTQPLSGAELLGRWRELVNPIETFIHEACKIDPNARVPIDTLFEAWARWCAKNGKDSGTIQTFGRDLQATVPTLRVCRPRDGEKRQRVYEGISLQEDS